MRCLAGERLRVARCKQERKVMKKYNIWWRALRGDRRIRRATAMFTLGGVVAFPLGGCG
jgi:hypothetical protein